MTETAMFHSKSRFARYLSLGAYGAHQAGKAMARVKVLKRMTLSGMPDSIRSEITTGTQEGSPCRWSDLFNKAVAAVICIAM